MPYLGDVYHRAGLKAFKKKKKKIFAFFISGLHCINLALRIIIEISSFYLVFIVRRHSKQEHI